MVISRASVVDISLKAEFAILFKTKYILLTINLKKIFIQMFLDKKTTQNREKNIFLLQNIRNIANI